MPSQLQSPEIQAFATGFPITLLHAGVTLTMLVLGAVVYALLTPHKEITLIREGNSAAALSLGGVFVGGGGSFYLSYRQLTTPRSSPRRNHDTTPKS